MHYTLHILYTIHINRYASFHFDANTRQLRPRCHRRVSLWGTSYSDRPRFSRSILVPRSLEPRPLYIPWWCEGPTDSTIVVAGCQCMDHANASLTSSEAFDRRSDSGCWKFHFSLCVREVLLRVAIVRKCSKVLQYCSKVTDLRKGPAKLLQSSSTCGGLLCLTVCSSCGVLMAGAFGLQHPEIQPGRIRS